MGYCATGFYKSASLAQTDGLSWIAASGDQAMAFDRRTMIEMSRHFYRNNPIYQGIIDRAASAIVGEGFNLNMLSANTAYNEKVEALWKDWWERPEIRGLNTGRVVTRMVCTEILLGGGTILLKLDGGLLQQIEIEQCCGKNYASDGITKNEVGKPTKFRICAYGASGQVDQKTGREVNAEDVLFIANRDRPSSTHGAPALQSTFGNLHRINDVCDSVAIAWQAQSRFVLINKRDPTAQSYGENTADSGAPAGSLAPWVTNLGTAIIFNAALNETLEAIEHKIPGQNFPESLRMFLRLLGLPLGMPLEWILLDWTQSNFSQSKAVNSQAYRTKFADLQGLIEGDYYRKLLPWKVAQWIKEGKLPDRPKDGLKHEWGKTTPPWLNELEEAKAQGEKMDRTFTTHSAVCKGLQTEREDVCNAREAEIRDSIARAQRIEADTKVKVPWEIFAGLKIQPGQKPESPQPDEQDQTKDVKNDSQ